jgi:hypothetical protein
VGRAATVRHWSVTLSSPAPQVYGLDQNFVDPAMIAQKVIQGVYSGVTTSELDELAAQTGEWIDRCRGVLV